MRYATNGWPPYRLIAAVVGLHLAGVGLLMVGAAEGTMLFGLGGLAYLLGLRHAFDVDHIAAIDNVTRKLMAERRAAEFVGFAFSAGHSTVVFGLCLLIVLMSGMITGHLDGLAALGGVIGTVVSATFLSVMAALNARLVWRLWQGFAGKRHLSQPDHSLRAGTGPLARWIDRGTGWIDAAWKMYPLGFVFGLGFDTATEVALLGLSAGVAQHSGASPWTIMALPLLFAAGMTLLDSFNGLVMQRAYGWGEAGRRRLGFNLAVTALSVVVAAVVAGLKWTGLVADGLAPDSAVATVVAALPSAAIGLVVFGLFVALWWWWARRQQGPANPTAGE